MQSSLAEAIKTTTSEVSPVKPTNITFNFCQPSFHLLYYYNDLQCEILPCCLAGLPLHNKFFIFFQYLYLFTYLPTLSQCLIFKIWLCLSWYNNVGCVQLHKIPDICNSVNHVLLSRKSAHFIIFLTTNIHTDGMWIFVHFFTYFLNSSHACFSNKSERPSLKQRNKYSTSVMFFFCFCFCLFVCLLLFQSEKVKLVLET